MRDGERSGHHRGLRPGHGVTGGAWKRGRAHGFLRENQGEECRPARERLPALGGGSHLPGEPCRSKGHEARRALHGIGGGKGAPHAPERGSWPSERTRVPLAGTPRCLVGKVGNRCPRAPRAGRRSRAARFAGRTAGRAAGSTNRSQATPENGRPGQALSREGVQQGGARERPCVRAGSLSSDP